MVRADAEIQGAITIEGELEGSSWQQTINVQPWTGVEDDSEGVASVWARSKIEALMDQKYAGIPEAQIRPDVLQLALEHQLLSPYTSFVAVEETISRPASAQLKAGVVANAVPAGQSAHQYAYPSTATRSARSLVLACFMLFASALLILAGRKHRGQYDIFAS